MNFFENTRKPQGFGGKLMTKMMNIGHAKLSQWGFSNISVNPDAAVLDVGCGGGANIVLIVSYLLIVQSIICYKNQKHFNQFTMSLLFYVILFYIIFLPLYFPLSEFVNTGGTI